MLEKVTACDDLRVLILMGQSLLFFKALWYHFASVHPKIQGERAGATSLITHWLDLLPHSLTLKSPRLPWVMASAAMVKVVVYRCNRLTL